MGSLSGPLPTGQTVFSSSSTAFHPLGARFEDNQGRAFRYCKVGAVDLVAGNIIQSPAEVPNHQRNTAAAAAVGDKTITMTLGSTLASLDQYAEGWAMITLTPGNGYTYPIRTHPAADSGATLVVTLEPGWEVIVALTTSSDVTLVLNPYSGVIQSPATTLTGTLAGVANFILVATEFGWLGVRGPFATLIEDTITLVGSLVSGVSTLAGAGDPHTGVLPIVGTIMRDGVAAEECPVDWNLQ